MNWTWALRRATDILSGTDDQTTTSAADIDTPIEVPVTDTDTDTTTSSPTTTTNDDTPTPIFTRDQPLDTHIDLSVGGHITIDGWETVPVYEDTVDDTTNVDQYPPPPDSR